MVLFVFDVVVATLPLLNGGEIYFVDSGCVVIFRLISACK